MSTTATPRAPRSTTPIILGIVAALVAALVVVAVVLAAGDADDADDVATTAGDLASPTVGDAVDPLNATVVVDGEVLEPLRDEGADPAIGVAAPALSGTDYDGRAVTVTPGEDGPTLLVFLAHWCPHCNAEIPVLNEWRDSGGVPGDLRIVGVSTAVVDDRPNYPPGEWLEEMDWQWDVIADGPASSADGLPPAGRAYGVTAFPFFVLLDDDGNVAARGSGEKPIEYLEEMVGTVTD